MNKDRKKFLKQSLIDTITLIFLFLVIAAVLFTAVQFNVINFDNITADNSSTENYTFDNQTISCTGTSPEALEKCREQVGDKNLSKLNTSVNHSE